MVCDEGDMAMGQTLGRDARAAAGGPEPASKGSAPPWCVFLMTSFIADK